MPTLEWIGKSKVAYCGLGRLGSIQAVLQTTDPQIYG